MYHPLLSASLFVLLSPQSLFQSALATSTYTDSQYTSETDFQSALITAHDFFRGEHNATALSWNDSGADYASDYVQACQFKHSGGPTGENLAAGYPNASAVVDSWASERTSYNFDAAQFTYDTGHFTQVVWKTTSAVGCARAACDGQHGTPGWFVVCEYYPRGNIVGDFAANVQAQVEGRNSDTVESGIAAAGASRVPLRESIAVLGGAIGVAIVLW